MSIGSKRITIRVGDAMLDDIKAAVDKRNNGLNQVKNWTVTEYVIQAIVDKLNHDRRSRDASDRRRQQLIAENMPREYWEEEE